VLLVDLVLNGETMRVPAESCHDLGLALLNIDVSKIKALPLTPLDVEALHGPIPRDDVLDGRRAKVAIVRQAGSERGAIVECVERAAFGELDLKRGGRAVRWYASQERSHSIWAEGDAILVCVPASRRL
jgi:hypothetical protein